MLSVLQDWKQWMVFQLYSAAYWVLSVSHEDDYWPIDCVKEKEETPKLGLNYYWI